MLVYSLKLAHYAFDILWHYHYNWGSSHEAVWGAMARRCCGLFISHPMQESFAGLPTLHRVLYFGSCSPHRL